MKNKLFNFGVLSYENFRQATPPPPKIRDNWSKFRFNEQTEYDIFTVRIEAVKI